MKLSSSAFETRSALPDRFAFCVKKTDATPPITEGSNRNPPLAWADVPDGAKSLALVMVDSDVPATPDGVNVSNTDVAADRPRTEFYHWVVAHIPPNAKGFEEGIASDGVTARGKARDPGRLPGDCREGLNDYTQWFADDDDMAGSYVGYDGPCPPFNDLLEHRYFFRLFALDTADLKLEDDFSGPDLMRAIQGHVLAETAIYGTFSLNSSDGVVRHPHD